MSDDLEASKQAAWHAQTLAEEEERLSNDWRLTSQPGDRRGQVGGCAKRVDVAIETRDLFKKILAEGTQRVRVRLDRMIADVFARMAVRP